mmetsp:Transcript_55959/g.62631  ORF Transcript_55959/g.62631 Transcript_55959/m.62631 type:complete len:140 (-) Transcript_55959:107-526(-)
MVATMKTRTGGKRKEPPPPAKSTVVVGKKKSKVARTKSKAKSKVSFSAAETKSAKATKPAKALGRKRIKKRKVQLLVDPSGALPSISEEEIMASSSVAGVRDPLKNRYSSHVIIEHRKVAEKTDESGAESTDAGPSGVC